MLFQWLQNCYGRFEMSFPEDLSASIIKRSTGPIGDFQMPTCARLIQTEGVSQQWALRIDSSVIMSILRRYKQHVRFWNVGRNVVLRELEMLANALAHIGLNYPPGELFVLYEGL